MYEDSLKYWQKEMRSTESASPEHTKHLIAELYRFQDRPVPAFHFEGSPISIGYAVRNMDFRLPFAFRHTDPSRELSFSQEFLNDLLQFRSGSALFGARLHWQLAVQAEAMQISEFQLDPNFFSSDGRGPIFAARPNLIHTICMLSNFLSDFITGDAMPNHRGRIVVYDLVREIFHSCGGFLPMTNHCFICPKPTFIGIDNDLRAHSTVGPAVSYRTEGLRPYDIFAIHGVPVDSRIILDPENAITPQLILETRNLELKRTLTELYGLENYLHKTAATMLHYDETGYLYEVRTSAGRETVVLVTNATAEPDGHRKQYMLRVRPNCRTAREAVASTFGLSPEQYNPTQET